MEGEIENIMNVDEFIKMIEKLQEIGIDTFKVTSSDTIETLAQKSGMDIEHLEKWAKKQNINIKYKIGLKKNNIAQAYRGKGLSKKPTKKQAEKLKELGINLEKQDKDTIQDFIELLEKLQLIGVDITKITQTDTIETLAKKSGVDSKSIEEWTKNNHLNINTLIGLKKTNIAQAYRGKGEYKKPTKKQAEKLKELGINLEKQDKDTIQDFIELLEKLQLIGVDITKITQTDTIETLAQKSCVDIEYLKNWAKEQNIDIKNRIGAKKAGIGQAYRGNGTYKRPTEEQVKRFRELGIKFKKQDQNTIEDFIEILEKLQKIGINVDNMTTTDTIETLARKSGINREDLENLTKEYNLNIKYQVGKKKWHIGQAYRGITGCKKPTKEQVKRIKEFGISLEEQNIYTIQYFIETLKKLKLIGVDTSKIALQDTIETLARKSGINREDLEKWALENNIDIKWYIGAKKNNITSVHRGKMRGIKPTEEQIRELTELGISLERKKRTGKEIAEATISSIKDMDIADKEDEILKDLSKKSKEENMRNK